MNREAWAVVDLGFGDAGKGGIVDFLVRDRDAEPGEAHNSNDGFQGAFRTGALDAVLLRYAIAVCGGVDGLAVTCLDQLSRGAACDSYGSNGEIVRVLDAGAADDLDHRADLGRWLDGIEPVIEEVDLSTFVQASTGVSVVLESRGPEASAKSWTEERGCVVGKHA